MAQFLVRDVPENIAAALKKRARKNGRSTEAELRAILAETVKPKGADFWKKAEKLREELRAKGYSFTDSSVLIRQDRDSR
jgi:plasmid stability protein